MPSDTELLRAWREGDKRAGEQLLGRYCEAIGRFFFNKVSDQSEVIDLTQRTFLGCVEGVERIRNDSSFRSYLFGVAYRQLSAHYRQRKIWRERYELGTVSAHDLGPSPSQVLAARQGQRQLLEGLRRIPVEHQTVLELVYWEGLSVPEIAAALELPLGTMKSRVRRARQLLEQQLATITESAQQLESTLAKLEDWAAGLRREELRPNAGPGEGSPER